MPKRSRDASTTPSDVPVPERPVQQKTERSHEENQERAYIAASRRADRSIEARVKSAQMASDIHKKRTGKGFKISERIVQAEEMYEEEEDDMPQSYRLLTSHLQTNSPALNERVSAYLANRVVMASMVAGMENREWQDNPVHRLFAEHFPDANKHAQAMSQRLKDSAYYQPLMPPNDQANVSPVLSPQQSPAQLSQPDEFNAASIAPDNFSHMQMNQNQGAQMLDMSAHGGGGEQVSPSDLSTTTSADPLMTPGPSTISSASSMPPHSGYLGPESSFTAELPPEAKMLAAHGMDMSDPLAPCFMGADMGMDPMQFYSMGWEPDMKQSSQPDDTKLPMNMDVPDYFNPSMPPGAPFFPTAENQPSQTGTPVPGGADGWEALMDWSGCEPPQSSNNTYRDGNEP